MFLTVTLIQTPADWCVQFASLRCDIKVFCAFMEIGAAEAEALGSLVSVRLQQTLSVASLCSSVARHA